MEGFDASSLMGGGGGGKWASAKGDVSISPVYGFDLNAAVPWIVGGVVVAAVIGVVLILFGRK